MTPLNDWIPLAQLAVQVIVLAFLIRRARTD